MRRITKKPQLVTQGPNKGKYAIESFVGGNYKRLFLTKAEAEDRLKLKKVILDDKTGKISNCFNVFKGDNIFEVTRNKLLLSTIRKIN